MDVLIANKIGSLFYYRNTGSFASPAFTLQPSLILTPYRGVKAFVALHLAWGVNGLYAGLSDGTVEFYSLTRCQPTKPCNELGNCVFPEFQVSSCQCRDGVSGGLQCESCKSLYESTTHNCHNHTKTDFVCLFSPFLFLSLVVFSFCSSFPRSQITDDPKRFLQKYLKN